MPLNERCAKSKSTSTAFYTSIKTNYFFALKSSPQMPIFRQIKIPKEYRYHSEGTPTRK